MCEVAGEYSVSGTLLDGNLNVHPGERFQVQRRKRDGTYRTVATSPTFPTLPVAEVLPLLDQVAPMTGRPMIRTIREWSRR